MNPKRKGSQFERDVCRILTKWITGQDKELIFWRSAGSGSTFLNTGIAGDISSINSKGEELLNFFIIECKFHKNISFYELLEKKKNKLILSFWEQVERQSKILKKFSFLIFKQNRSDIILSIPIQVFNLIQKEIKFESYLNYNNKIIFLNFNEFLSKVNYSYFIEKLKNELHKQ